MPTLRSLRGVSSLVLAVLLVTAAVAPSWAAPADITFTVQSKDKAMPDPVCVGMPTMATFTICLFKKEANAEVPPGKVEVEEQEYILTTEKIVGKNVTLNGTIEKVNIGADVATFDKREKEQKVAGFTVTFDQKGTSVTLKKKATNDKPCMELMATVRYEVPGDKVVTLAGSVKLKGENNPRKERTEIKITALELTIDPNSTLECLKPENPVLLNSFVNPSGLVILDPKGKADDDPDRLAVTPENAAVISMHARKASPEDADKSVEGLITWKVEGVDLVTGTDKDEKGKPAKGGKAIFLQDGKSLTTITAGVKVNMYGVEEGRVRVTATLKGHDAPCEFYEALVVKQRNLIFRVQLLSLEGGTTSTRVSPKQAVEVIATANGYLRQVGVRLKPDPNKKTTDDGNKTVKDGINIVKDDKKNDVPGFFTVVVKKADSNLVRDVTDLPTVIRINNVPDVAQIAFFESFPDNKRGLNNERPGNTNFPSLKINYRIEERLTAQPHSMNINKENLTREGKTWGIGVSSPKAKPNSGITREYAQIASHELCHMMNLFHRSNNPKLQPDGLNLPAVQNLMNPSTNEFGRKSDLDLIQYLAITGSKALITPK